MNNSAQWIAIQDQLPAIDKVSLDEKMIYERCGVEPHISPVVLIHQTSGLLRLGYYFHNEKRWYEQEGQQIENGRVTHWMPLPTPPTQSGK